MSPFASRISSRLPVTLKRPPDASAPEISGWLTHPSPTSSGVSQPCVISHKAVQQSTIAYSPTRNKGCEYAIHDQATRRAENGGMVPAGRHHSVNSSARSSRKESRPTIERVAMQPQRRSLSRGSLGDRESASSEVVLIS